MANALCYYLFKNMKIFLDKGLGGGYNGPVSVKLKRFTGDMMQDKTYELTLLYDFFGELLTPTQREYFEYYYSDDLSLSEIGELAGVSRQGVRAVLQRAEALLREYEEKTGVVARFRQMSRDIDALRKDAERLAEMTQGQARELAGRIYSGLGELKG